jgi:hypothetical protein
MYLGHANFGDISLAMRKSMSYDIKIAHTYFIWKFHRFLFFLQNEKYYLRALGDNPRTDIADITKQFPELAEDIHIPQFFSPERFFSSVFRISSNGIQLWTHYDVIYYYSILSYNYLCNQCLSSQTKWVRIPLMARCTGYNIMW